MIFYSCLFFLLGRTTRQNTCEKRSQRALKMNKTTAQLHLQLPSEVWHHVFGYLSPAERFSVRAACSYFRTLIDHSSLWKHWTVVLAFHRGAYNSRFWATLRRRHVTSVVVRSSRAKDWKQLPRRLPAVTAVVVDRGSQLSVDSLKDFPDLKRLAIRSCSTSLLLDASTVSRPQQLTHLSMCDITFATTAMDALISTVSPFTNLKSLVCHHVGVFKEAMLVVHALLGCLPTLKHLSLSVVHRQCVYHSIPAYDPGALEQAHGLSSLELIDCMDYSLTEDVMKLVPHLKSLKVFYKHSERVMLERWLFPTYHLTSWLCDLPQLSSLVIVNGPPVRSYVTSLPATLSSLTLCVPGLSSEEMAAVSVQVPNLLHLYIDPWPSFLGPHTAQIPQLFPKLQSLKVRHEHVPEKDFLRLHQLQDLRCLEILDSRPHLSALTVKLQVLTNYRLWVKTPPHERDLLSCSCVFQV